MLSTPLLKMGCLKAMMPAKTGRGYLKEEMRKTMFFVWTWTSRIICSTLAHKKGYLEAKTARVGREAREN